MAESSIVRRSSSARKDGKWVESSIVRNVSFAKKNGCRFLASVFGYDYSNLSDSDFVDLVKQGESMVIKSRSDRLRILRDVRCPIHSSSLGHVVESGFSLADARLKYPRVRVIGCIKDFPQLVGL